MGIIIKIFGEELIVYRVVQIIGLILIELFFVKILKKLNLENKFLAYVLLTCYMILVSIFSLFEYNMLNCLFLLIIINQELKEEKKILDYVLIGILLGLSIITKQSTGLLIFVSSIVVSLINKEKIKNILIKIFGAGIIVGLMILYLFITNSIGDLINYTILGLKYFKPYFGCLLYGNFLVALLIIFLICLEIISIIKTFKSKDKKAMMLLIYGFASLLVMYPIFEENHSLIGFLPNLLLYMYLFFKDEKCNERILKWFNITISFGIIILIILNVVNFIDLSYEKDFKHYKYIRIESSPKKTLKKVTEFINNNPNTYIINTLGIFYMIPEDRFNRNT